MKISKDAIIEVKRTIRIVFLFVGIYEFYSIYNKIHGMSSPDSASSQLFNPLFDSKLLFNERIAFYLYLLMNFYLGINRLTWFFSIQFNPRQNNFYVWLSAVLTHLAETVLLYFLAFLPHFNISGYGFVELVRNIVTGNIGSGDSRKGLLIAPFLLLLLVLHGPTVEIEMKDSTKRLIPGETLSQNPFPKKTT
jgi:hypothetical protein